MTTSGPVYLEPGEGSVWYFAFGSNMNPKTLTGRRKVVPQQSEPCCLPGYGLSFSHLGLPFAEPGFATIMDLSDPRVACPEGEAPPAVHGVVHLVSDKDWRQIQLTEGVGSTVVGYQVKQVDCELYDGRRVKAVTLQTHNSTLAPAGRTVLPSERYKRLLTEGAQHYNLSLEYRQYLDGLSAYQPRHLSKRLARYLTFAQALPFFPLFVGFRIIANKFYKDTKPPFFWLQAYLWYGLSTVFWTSSKYVLGPVCGSPSCNTGGWGPVSREIGVQGKAAGASAELNMRPISQKVDGWWWGRRCWGRVSGCHPGDLMSAAGWPLLNSTMQA